MDHADYLLMRAPQPTLICSATHDSFDITGTWDTFRQAKRFYARLGYPERADLIEIDERHGFTTHLREATARWMCRWLSGRDRPIVEEAFPIFTEEQVRCTPDGQVLRLSGEKSVFQFNWERQSGMAAQRRRLWRDNPAASMLERVREVVGVRRLADLPEPKHRSLGTLQRQGCRIEKLLLTPEPGIVLPGLAFFPAQPDGQACLYLHGQGKHADAGPGGPIENLLAKRMTVLAVDLRGVGETESRHTGEWPRPVFGPNGREFFLAYLLGRSLVGMMTEDALVCARFLAHWPAAGSPRKVHLVAVGKTGVPALHAAALEPELFASLSLTRTLESWSDVVATPVAKDHLVDAVHGALKVYDLPDLVHSLPEGFATIREPLRADGSPR
jgi:hypothetical protein